MHRNLLKHSDIERFQNLSTPSLASYNVDPTAQRHLAYTLAPKTRQLIDMVYFLGYSQEEVSKLLNIPLGTVKTRSRMGLQMLRSYFEELNNN